MLDVLITVGVYRYAFNFFPPPYHSINRGLILHLNARNHGIISKSSEQQTDSTQKGGGQA